MTVTIGTSAVAEWSTLILHRLFLGWLTIEYCPLAHWAWGGGSAQKLGLPDFAGGTVIEISSGVASFGLACVTGKRAGYGEYALKPHNIPIVLVGAALLWFGWSGGNVHQFPVNAFADDAAVIYAFCVTYAIGKIIDHAPEMRVSEDEEYVGLDICQHGECAYHYCAVPGFF